MTAFRDHFSGHASAYAAFRPRYPKPFLAALVDAAPARRLAWDCATGNGQAAVGLAAHVARVVASDASAAQLSHARAHPRVAYVAAAAEATPLRDRAVDLVTVAQAAHWLDLPAFYHEVRRVLVPGGLVALWCYGLATVAPGIDAVVRRLYEETLGPYWPPGRALVDAAYRTIPFPFAEVALPDAWMEHALTLDELASYVGTWSAVQRYRRATGEDPVPSLAAELAPHWGDPAARRVVRWPLAVRAGRHDPGA